MSSGRGALGDGNQRCQQKSARKASPENIAGGVAAATIAAACAWFAFSSIPGAYTGIAANFAPTRQSIDDIQTSTPSKVSFAHRFSSVSFSDRFGPVAKVAVVASLPQDTASATPETDEARAIRSIAMALRDPNYTLGAPPVTFMVKDTPLSIAAMPAPDPDLQSAPAARSASGARLAALAPTTPLPQMRPDVAGKRDLTSKSVLAINPDLGSKSDPSKSDPSALDHASKPEPRLSLARATSHEVMVQRARATVHATGSSLGSGPLSGSSIKSAYEKLFGGSPAPTAIAYAAPDGGVRSDGTDSIMMNESSPYDRYTAIYDIAAKTVYMPDGSKLEAHSGLGAKMDDPKYVHVRMNGATPPHIYDLKPREALFHGVAALRMTPVGGESAIHGRTGLLTHSYLLGPRGDSNGCVSFRDYQAFLKAYRNNEVKRLVVVASLN